MATLTITRGLPGSGKTSWARQQDAVALCRDDMRRSLYGPDADHSKLPHEQESIVTKAHRAAVEALLRSGTDVIEHSMNLRSAYVREWAELAAACGAEFDVHDMTNVSPELCALQDMERRNAVGIEVIEDLWRRFVRGNPYPLPMPEPRTNKRVPADNRWRVSRPDAVIVDIDGTIAHNDGHRGWYEYDKVDGDTPHVDIVDLALVIQETGAHLIFVSGRSEDCRELTEIWIRKHVYQVDFELYMRKSGDHRNDAVVKYELFDEFIRDRFNIWFVLDDRDRVVRMWRDDLKLRCLQVAPGAF